MGGELMRMMLLVATLLGLAGAAVAAWPGSGRYAGTGGAGCSHSLNFSASCNSANIAVML
jgi:hypothetical protein